MSTVVNSMYEYTMPVSSQFARGPTMMPRLKDSSLVWYGHASFRDSLRSVLLLDMVPEVRAAQLQAAHELCASERPPRRRADSMKSRS